MASSETEKAESARSPATLTKHYTRFVFPPAVTLIGVTALLYLGRDVLLPLAVALLLTFALAPVVSFLRRRGTPRIVAVVVTAIFAFSLIGLLSFVLASQVTILAQNTPAYQSNIIGKIRSLKTAGKEGGIVDRVTRAVERVGAELRSPAEPPSPTASPEPVEREPIPVEVVPSQGPLQILEDIVVPLVQPFATMGLIIVLVLFMLLERENLRDRFIRLAGSGDLNRTTEALQDAGRRVAQYLLMQLVINTTYAIPITIGLWLIGVPNALLWGLLTLVLRFVPYIGPAIGMFLPMLVAFAALPGWTPVLMVGGLFILMELISNNVMEPWLYGSRTGLSSLAIIVAAIFWSWLWGPLGLVLSTPLTVCLVVLGRHVPQFEFLDVLLGNEPVLEPPARIYQRLLAGDPDEAADYAEEFLKEEYLVDFYEKVGIPALMLAEQDRQRGSVAPEREALFVSSVQALVEDLQEIAEEEEEEDDEEERTDNSGNPTIELPDGEGKSLLCIGGRGELDDAASIMLAQVLEVQGASVIRARHNQLASDGITQLPLESIQTVVISYLNAASSAQARYAVRRLKRMRPALRVGLFMPDAPMEDDSVPGVPSAGSIGADFLAHTIAEAAENGFADTKPVKIKATGKRRAPNRASRAKPKRAAVSA